MAVLSTALWPEARVGVIFLGGPDPGPSVVLSPL